MCAREPRILQNSGLGVERQLPWLQYELHPLLDWGPCMSIVWLLTNALSAFLLPPLSLVLMGALGWRLQARYLWLGRTLLGAAVFLLLALATSAGSGLIIAPLERPFLVVADPKQSAAQAIVVLGGGRSFAAPEDQGRDQPSSVSLVRLKHAARLQRMTGLPLLVSGGAPDDGGESEASVMQRSLQEDFKVPVRWIESRSENTFQNARYAALELKQAGVQRILLVTDALHMARAQTAFVSAGLEVVPAPTAFKQTHALMPADFIPKGSAFANSHYALHEWIGQWWYRLRHSMSD